MEAKITDNKLTLHVMGNLVASNLDQQMIAAKEALQSNSSVEAVILDLMNVSEIDSMGINLVVGLYKQSISMQKKFFVTNVSRPILNLFNLFKLTSYFEVI